MTISPAPVHRPCWAAVSDACDPNKTKALLMGEFTTEAPEGHGIVGGVTVDWTTIKEIQAAILEQVKLNLGWKCRECGCITHILTIRDRGLKTCCKGRFLVPPNSTMCREGTITIGRGGDGTPGHDCHD
jgi:hypothetical protein